MILVETVGVGQGEIEIVRLADCTIVVLVPGMGDDVQSLKAGLMEIADIFVVNKSDREGADRFEEQLGAILQIVPERDGWQPPVVRTVATEDQGVAELAAPDRAVPRARKQVRKTVRRANSRTGRNGCCGWWRRGWSSECWAIAPSAEAFEKMAAEVAARKKDPYSAVNEILSRERRVKLGELEFHVISAGHVLLDGGAMFGVIPRPLWEKKMPPDARNRITLSMNCLLIHAGGQAHSGRNRRRRQDERKAARDLRPRWSVSRRGPAQIRRASRGYRHRDRHASAFRPLRREHARREGQSRAGVSECALRRAARRIRARHESQRARPRQLFPGKLTSRSKPPESSRFSKVTQKSRRAWSDPAVPATPPTCRA